MLSRLPSRTYRALFRGILIPHRSGLANLDKSCFVTPVEATLASVAAVSAAIGVSAQADAAWIKFHGKEQQENVEVERVFRWAGRCALRLMWWVLRLVAYRFARIISDTFGRAALLRSVGVRIGQLVRYPSIRFADREAGGVVFRLIGGVGALFLLYYQLR